MDTSRVGLQSPWCTSLTTVYVDPGGLHTGSACSNLSGRMGRGLTSFGMDPRKPNPNSSHPPPSNTNEQIKRHPPDIPIQEMNPQPERKIREKKTECWWQISRRGDRVHLSLLEKDNSTASIKLIN